MKKLRLTLCLILIATSAIAGTWIDDFSRRGNWQVIGDNSKWIIENGENLNIMSTNWKEENGALWQVAMQCGLNSRYDSLSS